MLVTDDLTVSAAEAGAARPGSFARNGEDVVLLRALGDRPGGRFIEVRADPAAEPGVLLALVDRGWVGSVVDLDDPTRDVPQGERGELLIKGPQVFQGYWMNADETARTLLPGGWLRTGDVVVVDADGFTTIVDRVKEIIITGGFNVAPSEVEQVLVLHPGVRDAAVVGVPNEEVGGENVVAAVVAEPGTAPTHLELRAWCKERLTGYKVPREFFVVDELPKSMLGKVLRAKVREEIAGREPLPRV